MQKRHANRMAGARRLLCAAGTLLAVACVEQTQDGAGPTEEDIQAARAHVLTPDKAPTPRYPSGAVLTGPGDARIVYLGMDVDSDALVIGKGATLTHYFRVEKPAADGWKLFVHVDSPPDGAGRRNHFTADHVPISGKYPVPRWQAGEIIRDIHRVTLPPSWVGDKVQVLVGFWKGGSRFAVSGGKQDGQNRVIAADLPVQGGAAPPPPRRLIVRKLAAGTKMNIDGKFDEPAWAEAASTGPFVNTMNGSPVPQAGSAKALWDDENLYLAFFFQDSDVWGTLDKHDDKLWTQEVAEVFIDADGDGRTYVELQVSPKNVTFDSWLPTYRANDNAWDAPMQTAVQVDGTVNQRDDDDRSWQVEMRIPLSAVKGRLESMRGVPPVPGTIWRANFFRFDFPKGKPPVASGWSPPLVGDFHALDKFGQLAFGDEKGQVPTTNPALRSAAPGELPPVLQRAVMAEPGKESLPAMPQVMPPSGLPGATPVRGAPPGDVTKPAAPAAAPAPAASPAGAPGAAGKGAGKAAPPAKPSQH